MGIQNCMEYLLEVIPGNLGRKRRRGEEVLGESEHLEEQWKYCAVRSEDL